MNTPEVRESSIKGFIRYQKEQGGIIPSKLKEGTVVYIETNQYVYELKVLSTPAGKRFLLQTGSPMCRGNDVIINIQSHSAKLKYDMDDWIGRDMRPIFKFANGNSILVGDVKTAFVKGVNQDGKEYKFEFWKE